MLENERPVLVVKMLVKADTRRRSRQYAFKCGLTHRKRIAPHVIPVKLDHVERPHEHVCVMPPVPDAIEAGYAIVPARHSFPVDNAGPRTQLGERFDNPGKAMG
jgi:hypothetical protein